VCVGTTTTGGAAAPELGTGETPAVAATTAPTAAAEVEEEEELELEGAWGRGRRSIVRVSGAPSPALTAARTVWMTSFSVHPRSDTPTGH
jgi:hypothetical protein